MRIGILQAGHAPDEVLPKQGDFDCMFAALLDGHGFQFTTYDVVDMVFPHSPDAADGWLITGSRHGVYEDHAFIPPLEEFIRAIAQSKKRLIGVCFGHQIIAQALGGRVEKFSGGWALGRQTYNDEMLGEIALNAWHQDQVVCPPQGARVIASNDFCAHAALAYGETIYTMQPHPEFSNPTIETFIACRRGTGTYPDDLMERAEQANGMGNDAHVLAGRMAAFFKGDVSFSPLPRDTGDEQ